MEKMKHDQPVVAESGPWYTVDERGIPTTTHVKTASGEVLRVLSDEESRELMKKWEQGIRG